MLRSRLIAILLSFVAFSTPLLVTHPAHAQQEGEDAYDPFADYSEFDEASDEESDINFFRHGRFFTIGFAGGFRAFTGAMSKLYAPNMSYGLYMSYFFDLRLALQFGFLTGDHAFDLGDSREKVEGNVSFTFVNFDLKYFLTTQNVSRGLADLNPYFFGGLHQAYRAYSLAGDGQVGKDSTFGLNFGGGVEIPIVRKKSYLGIQATYRYFNFPDENKEMNLPDAGIPSGKKPYGDSIDLLGIIGMSF